MRVLLRPFDYLLLDEPFSHLDDTNVDAMTNLIEEEINRREAGLILASLEENSPFEDLRLLRF
jgi:putative ABC transport system ATP-binding protein